jgi:hypothetical protein
MDPVVREVLLAIARRDRDLLTPLLHPYLHWTGPDGTTIRGRIRVLAHLDQRADVRPPARHELRDGQVYRWVEPR